MKLGHFEISFGRKSEPLTAEKPEVRRANLRDEMHEAQERGFQYEAAKSDRLNQEHWADARGQLLNNELRVSLTRLRQRAALESKRNPTFAGVVETHRTDVVGTSGPTLQLNSADEDYCTARKKIWTKWAKNPDAQGRQSLASLLRMLISSCWLSGSAVFQEVIKANADGPVKFRILAIDPARMVTPPKNFGDPDVGLGQRMDAYGAPVSYFFQNMDHFGDSWFWNGQYDEISAANIVHFYVQFEPNQFNGVPWCASALPGMAQLRDVDQAVLDAIEMQAEFAPVLFKQELQPGQEAVVFNGDIPIERQTARALPPGLDPFAIEANQPGDNYMDFRKAKQADIGTPVGMPLMLVLGNSGDWNLSSVRFDMGKYLRSVMWIRTEIEQQVVDRWEAAVAYEAFLAGELPAEPADLERNWSWPKLASADPKSDAETIEQEMINGTLGFSEACRMQDKDPEAVLADCEKWTKKRAEAGLQPTPYFQPKSLGAGTDPGAEPAAGGAKPKAKITAIAGGQK